MPQVRLFVWPVLFAAAGIATYFAGTALLAEAAGLRPQGEGSAINLVIDLGSMAGIAYVWRNDNRARDSRLARMGAGANIAALRAQLVGGEGEYVRLADFRRRSGGAADDARRVVMFAAEEAPLREALQGAAACAPGLAASDLLAVPVLLQPGSARLLSPLPLLAEMGLADAFAARSLAVPVEADLSSWQQALSSELETARSQAGDNVGARGLTVILKKNGRVGTRRLGTPDWRGLADDVAMRSAAGLDVKNI